MDEEKKQPTYEDFKGAIGSLSELSNMPESTPEETAMNLIAGLFAMEDAQFEIIAPTILDSFEKGLNNVEDKIGLIQIFNATGYKVEDLTTNFNEICEQLSNQVENISEVKRDFIKRVMGILLNTISDTEGIAKRFIQIPVEFCNEKAKMPAYAHLTDSGADVYALEDITIDPSETKLIPTGLKMAIPNGYEIQVRPKSGRCLKTKLRVANTPGTIDAGYRDEICVIIDNIEPKIKDVVIDDSGAVTGVLYGSSYTIGAGEKFAQLVLSEVPKAGFYKVDSVSELGEDRGGGFGSSGLK